MIYSIIIYLVILKPYSCNWTIVNDPQIPAINDWHQTAIDYSGQYVGVAGNIA